MVYSESRDVPSKPESRGIKSLVFGVSVLAVLAWMALR